MTNAYADRLRCKPTELTVDAVNAFTAANSILRSHGCLMWQRGTNGQGYGQARVLGRVWLITHLVLIVEGIAVPHGMHATHSCDRPRCVLRSHLSVESPKKNAQDAVVRRRCHAADGTVALPRGVRQELWRQYLARS